MIESFVGYLTTLPWWGIICVAFLLTFVENIFPPSPSDVLLVVCGTLIGLGVVGFIPVLISASIGSTIGFVAMFLAGKNFGNKIIEEKKFTFLPYESISKAEIWFKKYGYWVVVANRFMSGTRAIIAFVAGLSDLSLSKSAALSLISALLWNFILLYAGVLLGDNWREIEFYFSMYGRIFSLASVAAILIYLLYKKSRRSSI